MAVGLARAAARQWVAGHTTQDAGFRGAYFSGSTVGLPDEAPLPPSSDIDITLVTAQDEVPAKIGKFRYQDTLLEVSHQPWTELSNPERVLTTYYLAGSFRINTIISDPTGHLNTVHAYVSTHFSDSAWVSRRCENARQRIEDRLASLRKPAPFHEHVLSWLFSAGVTTHVLLVAALRNPTVRLRYPAVREVLTQYSELDHYEDLLDVLGCRTLSAHHVQHHLDELAATFDATAEVATTPFFFSSDITPDARPIAIDGSQHLIDAGDHREAMFWIIATFARCHIILAADDPQLHHERTPAFQTAVADLGIASPEDLLQRGTELTRFLPPLWHVAQKIMKHNPDITS